MCWAGMSCHRTRHTHAYTPTHKHTTPTTTTAITTTAITTTYTHPDPKAIFERCQEEFSADYLPCNPYQALALANLVRRGEGRGSR